MAHNHYIATEPVIPLFQVHFLHSEPLLHLLSKIIFKTGVISTEGGRTNIFSSKKKQRERWHSYTSVASTRA